MRFTKFVSFFLFVPIFVSGQVGKGVHFEQGSTWQQVLEKAKAEDKYIFMDCYATWCGPCKFMDDWVYPFEKVGESINRHFISVKVQVDSIKEDSENIRRWYADAAKISSQYQINQLPTFLFFSPDGEVVHRSSGSQNVDEFLATAEGALNVEKQYYTLLGKFKQHSATFDEIATLAIAAKTVPDEVTMREAAQAYEEGYLFTLKDQQLMNVENLTFLRKMMVSAEGKEFAFFKAHTAEIDEILVEKYGAKSSEKKMIEVIIQTALNPILNKLKTEKQWEEIEVQVKRRYGQIGVIAVRQHRLGYYMYEHPENGPAVGRAYVLYYRIVPDELELFSTNAAAWRVFQRVEDKSALAMACKKMKEYTNANPADGPAFDTYANLMYKRGNREEAMEIEKKALTLVKMEDQPYKEIKDNFEKMKAGKKTW